MKIKIKTDTSQFTKLLYNLQARVPEATKVGVHAAMKEFKSDCLFKSPSVPWDTMDLAKSHVVLPTIQKGDMITGTLKVSMPYAASLHEGISRWGTPYIFKYPGSGAKWIQSKMLSFKRKYIDMIERKTKQCL